MKRVSCIRATLETCHYRISFCKHIHNFSFAFVAPLEAEYNVKFHVVYYSLVNYRLEWEVIFRFAYLWRCRLDWLSILLLSV